jgi:hypothetical protein
VDDLGLFGVFLWWRFWDVKDTLHLGRNGGTNLRRGLLEASLVREDGVLWQERALAGDFERWGH